MRSGCALLIYLAVVFVSGALLAPGLYHLVQWSAGHWPGLDHLAHNPFHRYVDRALLGTALIGLWPLFLYLKMWNWREVGFSTDKRACKKAGAGFLMGFGSLAAVAVLTIVSGERQIHFGEHVGKQLLGATAAAIIVAILEETLFRGGLFGVLRKAQSWPVALIISSAVYSLVHFLMKGDLPMQVDWLSGLAVLAQKFRNLADWHLVVPAFFVLLMAGAILALAYQRTGSLYMSIGLHAGWIFWLQSYLALTKATAKGGSLLWGSDRLIDSWLAFLVLGGLFAVLWKRLPDETRAT